MKTKLILFLCLTSSFLFSQSREEILKSDVYKMKFLYLNDNINNNIPKFAKFLYYNMKIDEEGLVKRIKSNQEKAKSNAENLIYIYYKDFSHPIKFNDKYQSAFTKVMLIDTPKGKIVREYSMVGIFDEYDKYWRIIDTSILSDEELKVHFPTLSDRIVKAIKPMLQYDFDNENLVNKCKDYRNIELTSTSPFNFKKQNIVVLETEKTDTTADSYYLMDIIRDASNPCKIKSILKDLKRDKSRFKIGDEVEMEITAFDSNTYYFITKFKDDKTIYLDDSTIVKKIKIKKKK
ncbi:hypothetical protein LUD75_14555 [Epilithonimonas sp. JDS]|uniref:hypothetical protein n=1 Tax=Epilithonimonas sp. JDS TaxID=2902797 RepID=UPI001E62AA68|nr:hypothetical protein [Epilithonimonas sp. JDS]MCD9855944.1 hypothetical protein [Epilithonimonas sp. JDS]